MTITAGIDEAGYGPVLGPLVVAAAVFEGSAPTATSESSAHPGGVYSFGGLRIADSKKIYGGKKGGLAALETPVLAFLRLIGHQCSTFMDLLQAVRAPWLDDLQEYPWYRDRNIDLPVAEKNNAETIDRAADALATDLDEQGLSFRGLLAVPVCVSRLNASFSHTDNKSQTLFDAGSICLRRIWNPAAAQRLQAAPAKAQGALFESGPGAWGLRPGEQPTTVSQSPTNSLGDINLDDDHFILRSTPGLRPQAPGPLFAVHCDKLGGRNTYTPLLRALYPGARIEMREESALSSSYKLSAGDSAMEIGWQQGAESRHAAVALASMTAKYIRQLHMRLFNDWWRAAAPDLRPTEGYYTDAHRFLADVANHPHHKEALDTHLLRNR